VRQAICLSAAALLAVLPASAAPRPDSPRLVVPRSTIEKPPAYTLQFKLTCDAYMKPVLAYVALVNQGPGTVPAGTHVHYHMILTPPPDRDGDYVFVKKLPPNERVWMPYALPLNLNNGACTVTVQ